MAVASEYADPRALLSLLPFVRELGISIVSAEPGAVVVEMPFAERFSTPPRHFPASIVGTLGDVAAVSSCTSRLPRGWVGATLDYTVKMTAPAQGERLLARGRVLQAGQTISVGAADIFAVSGGNEVLCGTLLATARNFQLKDWSKFCGTFGGTNVIGQSREGAQRLLCRRADLSRSARGQSVTERAHVLSIAAG